jgi:hypothetical protein
MNRGPLLGGTNPPWRGGLEATGVALGGGMNRGPLVGGTNPPWRGGLEATGVALGGGMNRGPLVGGTNPPWRGILGVTEAVGGSLERPVGGAVLRGLGRGAMIKNAL